MSIKDLFDKNQEASQVLNSDSVKNAFKDAESEKYVKENIKKKERFIPQYDFNEPSNFARFGLAEEYYEQSIERVYNTYPYDGSRYEIQEWHNSSSFFDKHIFDNEYPRTTGYAIFGDNWGTRAELVHGYGAPATASYEYILIKGGPNKDSDNTNLKDMFPSNDGKSNIFNVKENRESNLKIGGVDGNTVEFWLKKTDFDVSNKTQKEVIIDVHTTSSISSSADYGRFRIEMDGDPPTSSPFLITYMSGASGIATASIGSGITTTSIADDNWHHYAFSVKNHEGQLKAKLYIDGEKNHQIVTGSSIGYVSGTMIGTIGALATRPSGTFIHDAIEWHEGPVDNNTDDQLQPDRGWGKLSASLDEFRYWKEERTAEDIGRNWYTNVYGGSNTDLANTQLGVYYKFNEGITGTSSLDSTVLDYSGRMTNGSWTGYSSANSSSYRSTGSAFDESFLSASEYKDPIIRSTHPDVKNKLTSLKKKGKYHDLSNNAAIYHSIPEWITSEDNVHGKNLIKLTQIISSYFDTLSLQMKGLPQLKSPTYPSSSFKPNPFAEQLLENHGLLVPELFSDSTVLNQFAQQDEKRVFSRDLRETKNLIYKNIYNNLSYIYKSKGTEKSFRNLIRCFGIDDEVIRVNIYGDNATYDIKDNYRHTITKKNYLNFNTIDTNKAVVYQYEPSSFITGSNDAFSGSAQTLEAEIIFPKPAHHRTTSYKFNEVTSSLFGFHTAGTEEDVLTWASPDQDIRVYAIREDNDDAKVHFKLESDFLGVIDNNHTFLTSSTFADVYNDEKWNFAVRIKRDIHPLASGVTSSLTPQETDMSGTLEFYGVNAVQNYVKNEFLVTASVSLGKISDLIESPKRVYVGAHRTNFNGALLQKSNVKASSIRFWFDHLSNETIKTHAYDVENYGTEHPYRNSYLFQGSDTKFDFHATGSRHVPQMETLALHWNFETLTGSDNSGEFSVIDASSGSSDSIRYGSATDDGYPLSDALMRQHPGKGEFFPSNSSKVVDKVYVSNAKQLPPETIAGSNMTEARTRDDRLLTRTSRPITHFIGIEKSPYQSITDEMLKLFSTLKDFNNLIGEPVNLYREKYKDMEKIRQLFFEKIDNTPDVEKYIDYYKWIDNAVNVILHQLMPASANTSQNLSTMIESHVLERNKFKHKYPIVTTVANYDIEGSSDGNEPEGNGDNAALFNFSSDDTNSQRLFSTSRVTTALANYPQSPMNTKKGVLWWKYRAERDKTEEISSGDSTVDAQREIYRKISVRKISDDSSCSDALNNWKCNINTKVFNLYSYIQSEYEGGANESTDKSSHAYSRNTLRPFSTTSILRATASNVMPSEESVLYGFKSTYDFEDEPVPGLPSGKKQKLRFSVQNVREDEIVKDNIAVPFQVYTSSVGRTITNIHNDSYIGREVPMQGPFTEKYVGGLQSRHIALNPSENLDTKYTRPQGFKIQVTSTPSTYENGSADAKKVITNANNGSLINYTPPDLDSNLTLDTELPRAMFYRDETAKRPVNIRNIKSASFGIGNYSKNYEIVVTNARSVNNKYFVEIEGAVSASTANSISSDLKDFALPERTKFESVIVNRFSSPGGPEVMSRGFLDTAAEEYSVYNALPFRNLSVRQPHQTLLKNHSLQFGYDSNLGDPSGSFHKVHRNTSYRLEFSGNAVITGSVKDNGFISRPIPQSDLQYSWITASAVQVSGGLVQNAQLPFGYEQPNQRYAGASNDIEFLTGSDAFFGWYKDDFSGPNKRQTINGLGLNTFFTDIIDITENKLTVGGRDLNGINNSILFNYLENVEYGDDGQVPLPNIGFINTHRGHKYGWPTWKQIRTADHPIARYQRRNNIYTFYENDKVETVKNINLLKSSATGYKDLKTMKQYTIPAVTTKFMPTKVDIDASPTITYVYTHTNDRNFLLSDEGLLDAKENIGDS